MSEQVATFEEVRQNYNDRLDILRQSRILYNKNKHRSIPNRGPYEYGLKVAQREFDAAKEALQALLETAKDAKPANDALTIAAQQASLDQVADVSGEEHNGTRRKRVFLAKLQQAEALKKELAMH
ncbi:MAG: hypothetical protein AAF434_14500 [Pseudomonadota bacterium]